MITVILGLLGFFVGAAITLLVGLLLIYVVYRR